LEQFYYDQPKQWVNHGKSMSNPWEIHE
jgi:hypothetical protein